MRGSFRNSSVATLLFAGLLSLCARGSAQSQTGASTQNREEQLALGKGVFVERCAKCHNERGDKPLAGGLALSERKLSSEQIARSVAGRLKALPDEQKRAVVLYIASFLKNQ